MIVQFGHPSPLQFDEEREVRRDRDEAEPLGDDLVEQGRDALVLLPVLRADRAEVELDVLDCHLGDVRDQSPPD